MKANHPDSHALKVVGTFEDGSPKTALDCSFIVGFDQKADELGILNPPQYRKR